MNKKTIKQLIKLNSELYENEAISWSKTRTELWEKTVTDFVKTIKPDSKVLDLGCGNARLYQILDKIGIDYTGIDPSKQFIKLNKQHYCHCEEQSDVTISHCPKFNIGDALSLNYKNKFDYVISLAVLHHIPSQELQLKFLKNIYNSLKPKGKTLISVWNRWQEKYAHYMNNPKQYSDMDKTDTLVPWKQTKHLRYIHCFTKEELENLAQKAGFKNVSSFYATKTQKSDKKNGLNIYLQATK